MFVEGPFLRVCYQEPKGNHRVLPHTPQESHIPRNRSNSTQNRPCDSNGRVQAAFPWW